MSPSECFDSCAYALSRLLDGFDCELDGTETEEEIAAKVSRAARLAHPWEDSGHSLLLTGEEWNAEDTIEDSWLTWAIAYKPEAIPRMWHQPRRKPHGTST